MDGRTDRWCYEISPKCIFAERKIADSPNMPNKNSPKLAASWQSRRPLGNLSNLVKNLGDLRDLDLGNLSLSILGGLSDPGFSGLSGFSGLGDLGLSILGGLSNPGLSGLGGLGSHSDFGLGGPGACPRLWHQEALVMLG